MFTIIHSSGEWILAGIVVVLSLIVFGVKLMRGNIVSIIIAGGVWWFVFTIHRGSTAGVMTATFAALLFDLVGMSLIRLFGGKK